MRCIATGPSSLIQTSIAAKPIHLELCDGFEVNEDRGNDESACFKPSLSGGEVVEEHVPFNLGGHDVCGLQRGLRK